MTPSNASVAALLILDVGSACLQFPLSLPLRLHHGAAIFADAVSKTASATGWRVGWIISSPVWTTRVRAVHDSLVIQAPTPLQKGVERFLRLPDSYPCTQQ